MICCIVLISRKWVGLDIFNNKWGDKYYLNVAKTENYTSRSGVRKRTLFLQSQKEIKICSTGGFLNCIVSFLRGKKVQKLLIDIQVYFYRNVVLGSSHRNNRHRMRAPIFSQSKICLHKMAHSKGHFYSVQTVRLLWQGISRGCGE